MGELGNGTPVQGVPLTPSRAYRRRASDKPTHRLLKLLGVVIALASPALSAVWALAQQAVVTRAEWNAVRLEQTAFEAKVLAGLEATAKALQRIEGHTKEEPPWENPRNPDRRPRSSAPRGPRSSSP